MLHLEIEVVVIGIGPQTYLFDDNLRCLGLDLLLFLLLLIKEFLIIYYFTNRRIGIWLNFNKVKIKIVSNFQGFLDGENTLGDIGPDDPDNR